MSEIIRKFNHVGQGAFYTEKHIIDKKEYNFVYDCGAKPNADCKQIIREVFNEQDTIDILFISHFDEDHVNCIKELVKRVKEIKIVIIPILYRISSILINGKYTFENIFTKNGQKPHFIFIIPGNNDGINYNLISDNNEIKLNNDEQIDFTKCNNDNYIHSNTKILNELTDWAFIPYNYSTEDRLKILKVELAKKHIDIIKLIQNPLSYKDKFDVIKNCYKELPKIKNAKDNNKVNEHSLLIYSGPLGKSSYKFDYHFPIHHHCCYCYFYDFNYHFLNYENLKNRVGCIYSGDSDWNCFDISEIFNNVYKNVGTIQIPHHGSKSNFKKIKGEFMLCPMSFGINNQYKHPSGSVIKDIIFTHNFPIFITEKKSFIEYISKK